MSFAVDVQLGTHYAASGSNALVTTNAAASGALIVVGVFLSNNTAGGTASLSGGGLTWQQDVANHNVAGANATYTFLFSAYAASGLAASTTLTCAFSGGSPADSHIGSMSFTGGKSSAWVDLTSSNAALTNASWNGGTMSTVTAGDLVVGCCGCDAANLTDTPGTGYTAGWTSGSAGGGDCCTFVYQLNVASGSYTPGGTWSASPSSNQVGLGAAYLAAAGTAAVIPDLTMAPMVAS